MSVIQSGYPGAVKRSEVRTFDPTYGDGIEEVWQGNRAAVEGKANEFRTDAGGTSRNGYRYAITHDGPLWELRVFKPLDDTGTDTEQPQDQWTIASEFAQIDVWSNDKIQGYFQNETTVNPAGEDVAYWRKFLEEELDNGTTASDLDWVTEGLSIDFQNFIRDLYRQLAAGMTSSEVRRVVLTRTRTISPEYASPVVLNAVENVYTTAALNSTFAVPAAIQAQLPSNPSTKPTGTTWGWRVREDTTQFVVLRNSVKVSETKRWTFAAWSNYQYTFITS